MTHFFFLLAGIVGALVAALVFIMLAANAVARHQDRVMSVPPIGSDPDTFLRALQGAAGESVVEGNDVEVLQNGDQIFPAMLAAIRESQSTIHFATYVYWAGEVPRQFATALAEAARRGVVVRLVLDSEGTNRMPRELVSQMRDAGCRVTWFRRMRWFDWMKYNNRAHRRLLIVDGKTGFTGGVGIADEWSGNAQSPSHWRDTHVRLTGPIVAALQSAFTDNWNQSTEELLLAARDFPVLTPTGDVPVCSVISTPANGASEAQRVMAALIAGSTRTLYISNAYFVPSASFVDALCAASDRGVDVRVLVPGPYHDMKIVRCASRHIWPRLIEHGVGIYEYQPTMMHAKTVVVDGELLLVGSINFDPRSFALNTEFGVVIVSRRLAADAMRTFEADSERAIRVPPGSLASRRIVDRAVNAACYWARAQF
jgi:cardiolipin synthase A/B